MADITPNVPGGALPPKPVEAAKIQPKKETVRINLPPKPTAAPTIKLPTLPAGAPPPPSSAAAAPVAAAAPASSHAPRPPAPPSSGTSLRSAPPGASATAPRPAAAAAPVSRAAAPAIATISGLDKGLAIAAAICALIGVVSVAYLAFMVYQPAP